MQNLSLVYLDLDSASLNSSHFMIPSSLLPSAPTSHFTGYNGFPRGCSDDALPWARHGEGGFLDTKYAYVCHAEMNAILNRNIAPLHG